MGRVAQPTKPQLYYIQLLAVVMALNDVFDMLNMALGGEADPKGIRGNRPAMEAIALEKALEHCRTIETTTAIFCVCH